MLPCSPCDAARRAPTGATVSTGARVARQAGAALRDTSVAAESSVEPPAPPSAAQALVADMDAQVTRISTSRCGVVLTMRNGGVGKTSEARRIAGELARRGLRVHRTTTDPANRNGFRARPLRTGRQRVAHAARGSERGGGPVGRSRSSDATYEDARV